jgi:hypothetical protein
MEGMQEQLDQIQKSMAGPTRYIQFGVIPIATLAIWAIIGGILGGQKGAIQGAVIGGAVGTGVAVITPGEQLVLQKVDHGSRLFRMSIQD